MKSSKEKNSNTKSYNNASDDPVFRTRESQNSKEDKYDPSKYSVHYNTLNDPAEDLATTKSKEQVPKDLQLKKSSLERISERQTKSSQSHIKLKKAKEQDQDQDAFSEGLGNRTIRETSELQMTVDFKDNKGLLSLKDQLEEGRLTEYKMEEEQLICYRFPHLTFCGCAIRCEIAMKEIHPMEVYDGLFVGSLKTAYATKNLLRNGITHILNLSSNEYTKRTKYFRYLTIDIYNSNDEDIKKHFRITNRFISEALINNGKVLIHDINGKSRGPAFALAYLINVVKIPLKNCAETLMNSMIDKPEINHYFLKQLEQYDLENLANISSKKKNL